jgi:hypothetical protein
MAGDRLDSHWKQPPEEDLAAWINELRQRSHDVANWASRLEGLVTEANQKLSTMSSAEEIATIVEKRLQNHLFKMIGKTPKVVGAVVVALQLAILVRK